MFDLYPIAQRVHFFPRIRHLFSLQTSIKGQFWPMRTAVLHISWLLLKERYICSIEKIYQLNMTITLKYCQYCPTGWAGNPGILQGLYTTAAEFNGSMHNRLFSGTKGVLQRKQFTVLKVVISERCISSVEDIHPLNKTTEIKSFVDGDPQAEPDIHENCSGAQIMIYKSCSSNSSYTNGMVRSPRCIILNENKLVRFLDCHVFNLI